MLSVHLHILHVPDAVSRKKKTFCAAFVIKIKLGAKISFFRKFSLSFFAKKAVNFQETFPEHTVVEIYKRMFFHKFFNILKFKFYVNGAYAPKNKSAFLNSYM
jgi:hypothetical protein